MFTTFIQFIYNNFFLITVIFIAVVLSIYFLQKSIREFMLNKQLMGFQRALRTAQLRFRKKRLSILTVMIIIPILVLVGIIEMNRTPEIHFVDHVTRLSSTEEVVSIYQNYHQKFSGNNFRDMDSIADFEALNKLSETTTPFSQGFDDMDLIKTDENYLYVLNHEMLSILNINEELTSIHKQISFDFDFEDDKTFFPMGLYVDADRVVVIGNVYEYTYQYEDLLGFNPRFGNNAQVYIHVYDKNADFALITEYVIRGAASDARKRGNQLVLVIKEELPFNEEMLDIKDHLPNVVVNSVKLNTRFEDIKYIEGTQPKGFTTFVSIDLNTFQVKQEITLGDLNNNVYISNQSIYLTSNSYRFLDSADLFVTSNPVSETRTAVSKINFSGNDFEYVTTRMIKGAILNLFAIDEYQGHLRIISTEIDNDTMISRLTILNSNLNIVSTINQIGEANKQLKSVRFLGDYAYITTQDVENPFYILNVSNANEPFIENQLNILGFSNYLHSINETHIVGVGYLRSSDERITGLRISVFSVANPKSPELLFEENMLFRDYGYTSSEALYNPRLFIYSQKHNMIVIPINNYDWRPTARQTAGLAIYHISLVEGISYNNFIQHKDENIPYTRYRALFIGDYLYSVSYGYVAVAHKDNLTENLITIDLYENN
ncbi:beta-propeller domain-containing protein [Liberiplasma polymorphum]|jgi:inhibitor of cysteine peptidase|uniref:beta-propeller domain-containing protein n=1 Tax=Liberiplasma polymorphum TaxID=3374570 RepID=UPI003771A064